MFPTASPLFFHQSGTLSKIHNFFGSIDILNYTNNCNTTSPIRSDDHRRNGSHLESVHCHPYHSWSCSLQYNRYSIAIIGIRLVPQQIVYAFGGGIGGIEVHFKIAITINKGSNSTILRKANSSCSSGQSGVCRVSNGGKSDSLISVRGIDDIQSWCLIRRPEGFIQICVLRSSCRSQVRTDC